MASHGYLPSIKNYLDGAIAAGVSPAVLEIGVDQGCMMIPLVVHLMTHVQDYLFLGVDVLVQEQLKITIGNLPHRGGANLAQENSLSILPKIVESNVKFDVVLIDGDHNYHTVSRELEYLDKITKKSSIVIIDDYEGKWSERDLWYAERAGYESVETTTKRVDTEKHGVKAAVDEFLAKNSQWKSERPLAGEPIVLTLA